MRGSDRQSGSLFSYVSLEERIPARHPLRKIKAVVDAALADLDAEFAALYAAGGRPSIAPEWLIRAALLQILFGVRSETQLMEQLAYNLLFRWFVGLSIDEPVWVPTVFTKNRDRLLNTDIARKLMAAILANEKVAPLLSDEHFSVDGTLVEAWASFKSFKPKATGGSGEPPDTPPPADAKTTDEMATDETAGGTSEMAKADATIETTGVGRNIERDWRGQKWSNDTHASVTDPDARLYRKAKGKPAQLCFMVESRRGAVAWGSDWEPSLRFLFPLIKLDVPISGIQLSDWLYVRPTAGTGLGKRSVRITPSSP
jgi:transposase